MTSSAVLETTECAPRSSPFAVSQARPRRPTLVVIALVLVGVTLAELLLMRLFYRVGIFLPKEGAFADVYRIATTLGSFAFNLASILAAIALVGVAGRAWRAGRRRVGVAIGAFLVAAAAGIATKADLAVAVQRSVFLVLVVAVGFGALKRTRGSFRLAIAGATLAAVASAYAGLAADAVLAGSGGPMPGIAAAQILAEWASVVTSVLLFIGWWREPGPRRGPLIVGASLAALLTVAWLAAGSVTGILALWTSGLRLSAPIVVYIAALWCFSSAAAGWLKPRPWRSIGLVLLMAAGLLPASSYALMLVLLGLLFLTEAAAVGGLPRWGSEEPVSA